MVCVAQSRRAGGFHATAIHDLPALLTAALPALAEEIVLKDGTKLVGHMTGITSDKIEVENLLWQGCN